MTPRSIAEIRPVIRRAAAVLLKNSSKVTARQMELAVWVWADRCKQEIAAWKKHPTKAQMKHKIDDALRLMRQLKLCLEDEQVSNACGEVWLAALPRKLDRKITGQTEEQFRSLNQVEKNRLVVLKKINELEIAFDFMTNDFGLKNQGGRFRAWSSNHLEPKQFLTLLGMQLFMAIRGLDRTPGSNNLDLCEFLSLLWELASGEADVSDWTTPIRVVRGSQYLKFDERFHARYTAQLVVDDLLEDMRKYLEGFSELQKDELRPPKLARIPE